MLKNFEMDVFYFYEQEKHHNTPFNAPTNRIFSSISIGFQCKCVRCQNEKWSPSYRPFLHIFRSMDVQWPEFTVRVRKTGIYFVIWHSCTVSVNTELWGGGGERERNPVVDENPRRIHASGITFSKIVGKFSWQRGRWSEF